MTPVSQLSDAALSALFAVKVAGWTEGGPASGIGDCRSWNSPDGKLKNVFVIFDFATSADAVLPWLNEHRWHADYISNWRHLENKNEYLCSLNVGEGLGKLAVGPTFPRAACLALLYLKGITKVDAPAVSGN